MMAGVNSIFTGDSAVREAGAAGAGGADAGAPVLRLSQILRATRAVPMIVSLSCASCNSDQSPKPPVPTPSLGHLHPLSRVMRVSLIPTITESNFRPYAADCSSDYALAISLWGKGLASLSSSSDPRFEDWGVAHVKLKRGNGKLVQLRRSFAPVDPGFRSYADDFYLVNDACRVVLWDFGQDV